MEKYKEIALRMGLDLVRDLDKVSEAIEAGKCELSGLMVNPETGYG